MTVDVAPSASVPEVQHISGEARLSHDGWVSEFEAFRWSAEARNAGGGGGKLPAVPTSARSGHSGRSSATKRSAGGSGGNPSKAMDNLRAEIKLLHWHKLANEAALKAALLKTKKIKAKGWDAKPVPATSTLAMSIEERAAWMQQVIEEEQSKPLQVTKDFMSKYEERERQTEGRLDSEVAGHIRSLRNLRKQIEKREEMKERRAKYRAAQKRLEVEKERLQLGKLQPEEDEPASAQSRTRLGQGRTGGEDGRVGEVSGGLQQGSQQTIGALNTVLGSLDKLVELEKRITSLEKNNVYDDFRATKQAGAEPATGHARHSARRRSSDGGRMAAGGTSASSPISRGGRNMSGARRGRLSFSKQRTEATIEAPSQVYYAVRVRNRRVGSTSGDSMSRRSRRVGRGVTSANMRPRAAGAPDGHARGAAATFLTQLPDVHRTSRVTGARALGGGAGAGGGFRSAIAEKKRLEAKRKIAGNRAEAARIARQDGIIREWLQRKKTSAAAGQRQRKSSVLSGAGSAITGVSRRTRPPGVTAPRRATNTHLQEFRDIRAQYAKRTEKLRRDLSHRRRGPEPAPFVAGTRTPSIARPRATGLTAASITPARPRGGVMRGPGLRGRVTAVEYRARVPRARGGVRVAIGGTGLRAARAWKQQGSRTIGAAETASANDSGSRRRDGSWRERECGALPRVGGSGRRAVGRGLT